MNVYSNGCQNMIVIKVKRILKIDELAFELLSVNQQ